MMDIIAKINKLRKDRRNFISNAFWNVTQINEFFSNPDIIKVESSSAIVFFTKQEDFYKCHFYSNSLVELERAIIKGLKMIEENEKVVIEMVSNNVLDKELALFFRRMGFTGHSTYKRMYCNEFLNFEDYQYNNEVQLATQNDIEEIYQLLHENFDIIGDYLPDLDEISKRILSNQITCIKMNSDLAGLSIFEDRGTSMIYLRAIFIKPEFRGLKIGQDLIIHKMNQNKNKRFTLWVREDNDAALRMYKKLNFIEDGLKNYIFVKKVES